MLFLLSLNAPCDNFLIEKLIYLLMRVQSCKMRFGHSLLFFDCGAPLSPDAHQYSFVLLLSIIIMFLFFFWGGGRQLQIASGLLAFSF